MAILERLQAMVNKAFLFRGENVVILNFCEGTGENADEVEIYLNNGKVLVFNYAQLSYRLDEFRPVDNTVIVLAEKKLNAVSTINPTIIEQLKSTVMQQIEAVKQDPNCVAQAKQVFQGVNTLINLARTELDYRKYVDNQKIELQ